MRARRSVAAPRNDQNKGMPMTTFDEREKAFEKRFALDEELRFKATVRRNKLLGLWAAEKLGLSGPEADAYAKDVIRADFQKPGDEDLVAKLREDFDAKSVAQSDDQIRAALLETMATAVQQIEAERGKAG
jgi:hypothetical protein